MDPAKTVEYIAAEQFRQINENKTISDNNLLTLHFLFQDNFVKGLEVGYHHHSILLPLLYIPHMDIRLFTSLYLYVL